MDALLQSVRQEPVIAFAILLAVILLVPPLFERLRLPGLVGLLAAGVLLGPQGLGVLNKESEALELLSDIGLVYLMFVAGLEVDLAQFNRTKHRSAAYGVFTFIVPAITGTIVGRVFGFDWNAAILIGSLFASHTLLAYPIVSRLGVVTNEAVTVTIGATIFTDIGALLVLAICVGIHAGNFSAFDVVRLVISLLLYSAVVLFGFDRLGRAFLSRLGDEEGNQFLFVLLVVFLAAIGAELVGVEKIVGAFLAGLAVNDALGESPVKEKVVFVGSVLFIPIFFVDLGLLVDFPAFVRSLTSIGLTLAIVAGLIGSKFLAAVCAKLCYGYSWRQTLTMWSLSMPQVAATLAATLVGYRVGLLSEGVLNGVIVLMLVTSTLGPFLTLRFASGLTTGTDAAEEIASGESDNGELVPRDRPFRAVVPVSNPQTEQYLMELAALLARHARGLVLPLSIATGHVHMDAPALTEAMERSQSLLRNAAQIAVEMGVETQPILRIDSDTAQGISRASRECDASLIVMGWSAGGIRARLFGTTIDRVLWATHCPVAISRLLDSPLQVRRILIPLKSPDRRAIPPIQFAAILAAANQAIITLLHVCDRHASEAAIAWNREQFALLAERYAPGMAVEIAIQSAADPAPAIAQFAQGYDLVILRTFRRRTSAGGLAIGDVSGRLVQLLRCSMVTIGEPVGSPATFL